MEGQQLAQLHEHANLDGQLLDVVDGDVELGELAQAADGGGQILQLVVVDVQLRQKGVVEQGGREGLQVLDAAVERGPDLVRVLDLEDGAVAVPVLLVAVLGLGAVAEGGEGPAGARVVARVRVGQAHVLGLGGELYLHGPVLVGRSRQGDLQAVGRAILLQVGRGELGRAVGQGAAGEVVVVVGVAAAVAVAGVVLVLLVLDVVLLLLIALVVAKGLVHAHLHEAAVVVAAIEHAVLSLRMALVVHD
ncbi:MAG: hypothetical protein INR71_00990 [Terriglobus roseus]|nr:hypothetical protein [Terriglobus roseus]